MPCTEFDICGSVNIPLEILLEHPTCLEQAPRSLSLKIFHCIAFQKLHFFLCQQDIFAFCVQRFLCPFELWKHLNKFGKAQVQ